MANSYLLSTRTVTMIAYLKLVSLCLKIISKDMINVRPSGDSVIGHLSYWIIMLVLSVTSLGLKVSYYIRSCVTCMVLILSLFIAISWLFIKSQYLNTCVVSLKIVVIGIVLTRHLMTMVNGQGLAQISASVWDLVAECYRLHPIRISIQYAWSLSKSHTHWYPCPSNINSLWNIGFLLISSLINQIISGLLLASYYTSDICHSYSSVIHIIQDITYGWYLHYWHSIGASIILVITYLHSGRSLYIGSFMYNTNLWLSGVSITIFLMLIAFLGYILIWGMMSYWGGTVITNLLSLMPCLIECICGGFYVSNPTLKRFLVFHIIIAFLINVLFIIHLYYLHGQSSTCSLGYTTNNLSIYLSMILVKDCYSLYLMMCILTFHLFWAIYNICHPDNHTEVNSLVTPFHINPEWYFLIFYTILKVLPNKLLGLIFFILCLMIICIVSEVKNVCNISRLISVFSNNDNLFITYLFLLIISSVCIGVQITQDIYLLWGRVVIALFNALLWTIICSSRVYALA